MKNAWIILALSALPTLVFARQTAPRLTSQATPTSAVTSAPSPAVSPSPVISSPSPWPAVTPMIAPSTLPTPLILGADAPPQILAISVNEAVFHSGDTIASTVITSTNVAAVELRVAGHALRFPRIDFGVWQLSYRLPHIPRRMLHNYAGQIAAMNSAGVTATIPVTIPLR